MRYIRFLKTPRIVQEKNATKAHAYCLITITSDLGDSFLPFDLTLSTELLYAKTDDVILWKTVQWTAGMRSLPVTLPLSTRASQRAWAFRVRIGVEPKSRCDNFDWLLQEDYRGVVSAWSTPLNPACGINEAEKLVERRFRAHGNILRIDENTSESIARHLWDAGVTLSCRIGDLFSESGALQKTLKRPKHSKRLQVLELGSGCGMVAIAIAQTLPGADVIPTDLPEAREINNRNSGSTATASDSQLKFQELDWDKDVPADFNNWTTCPHCQQIDLIVAADCTYNPDSSPALVRTIRQIATLSPDVTVAIAMKMRHSSEKVFFKLMSEAGFKTVDTITWPLPGDERVGEEEILLYIYHCEGEGLQDVVHDRTCGKHRCYRNCGCF